MTKQIHSTFKREDMKQIKFRLAPDNAAQLKEALDSIGLSLQDWLEGVCYEFIEEYEERESFLRDAMNGNF